MIKNPARTLIYLASRSPRRRELLKQIGVSFEVLVLREHPARGPDVDESHLPGELPDDYVRRVCRAKADVCWACSRPLNGLIRTIGRFGHGGSPWVLGREGGIG